MPEVYPIDTSALQKGDVIPMSQLVEITKASPGTSRYAFWLMKLTKFISRAMAMRGVPATVVIRKSEIHVLTDAEANEYNMQTARIGARRIRRATVRHSVIDLSHLTEDQRKDWDRNASRLALMVNGLKSKKLPPPEPHKRIT